MTSLIAWYRVLKWEVRFRITKALMIHRFGMASPNYGGTIRNKHDEWVKQIWVNRQRTATYKIIDLCKHLRGVDEDGYCVVCTCEVQL